MHYIIRGLLVGSVVAAAGIATAAQAAAPSKALFLAIGEVSRAPVGWIEFCAENPTDCAPDTASAQDASTPKVQSWREVTRINKFVNDSIKPMTDLDHHGVVEKWSYPDDGYGDCEDYVLLKRRMLMDAGWPRGALLVTVVRDQNGDGHAVLTVSTDKGDFILDNQAASVRLWSETPYHYVKRQSQSDPNVWVSLGDPRPAVATATSR
jgi:predicted transglutaminase-like cysteine proteinase